MRTGKWTDEWRVGRNIRLVVLQDSTFQKLRKKQLSESSDKHNYNLSQCLLCSIQMRIGRSVANLAVFPEHVPTTLLLASHLATGSGLLDVGHKICSLFWLFQTSKHHLGPWNVCLRIQKIFKEGSLLPNNSLLYIGSRI